MVGSFHPLVLAAVLAGVPGLARAQFVEPDAVTLRLFEGDSTGDTFGWVAAAVDDLDGDGAAEVLIPAITADTNAGRVTLYSGATGAVLNEIRGNPGDLLGFSVSAAGDVDGDGVPDYVVGGAQVLVLSGADHTVLLDLAATTGFGSAVSGAGDVDRDGHDDVLVGSQQAGFTFANAGRLTMISGRDGAVLWVRDGNAEGSLLGSGVGLVGDVDGDGEPDVVAGAFGAREAYLLAGGDGAILRTFVPVDPETSTTFGRFFASGAGDIDADGTGDVFIGDYDADEGTGKAYVFSGRTGASLHVLSGFSPGDGFGPGRGIPDANGDGHADLFIGAYTNSDGAPQAGQAYLFSGRSGALLRTITATLEGDTFGVDALAVGDVDGDAIPELLVTAVGLSFAGLDTGRAYLIAGVPLPCPADLNGNGRVGIADLARLLRSLYQGTHDIDLDGDGSTDRDDLRVLIADWGRCPAGVPGQP